MIVHSSKFFSSTKSDLFFLQLYRIENKSLFWFPASANSVFQGFVGEINVIFDEEQQKSQNDTTWIAQWEIKIAFSSKKCALERQRNNVSNEDLQMSDTCKHSFDDSVPNHGINIVFDRKKGFFYKKYISGTRLSEESCVFISCNISCKGILLWWITTKNIGRLKNANRSFFISLNLTKLNHISSPSLINRM